MELAAEHGRILVALDRIRHLSGAAGRAALFGVRDELLAHLAKEDERLYPALRTAARTDPHLARILGDLDDEMERLGRDAGAFFARWSEEEAAGLVFATELGRLAADLRLRIGREERVLYPAFRALGPPAGS